MRAYRATSGCDKCNYEPGGGKVRRLTIRDAIYREIIRATEDLRKAGETRAISPGVLTRFSSPVCDLPRKKGAREVSFRISCAVKGSDARIRGNLSTVIKNRTKSREREREGERGEFPG